MTRRLNKCTDYLLKLLKTYGSERIIVCTQPEPKTKAAMAFVKTNLLIVEMDFPFSQLETLEAHLPNPMMTTADLSVIFHRALIEYELAYVEQEYAGKEVTVEGDYSNAAFFSAFANFSSCFLLLSSILFWSTL